MKKNGFTLIELISVVVILSVLVLIVTPSITSLVDRGNEVNEEVVISQIIDATKDYVNNNYDVINRFKRVDDSVDVNISTLIDVGLIDEELLNNTEITSSSYVEVVLLANDKLSYELIK